MDLKLVIPLKRQFSGVRPPFPAGTSVTALVGSTKVLPEVLAVVFLPGTKKFIC